MAIYNDSFMDNATNVLDLAVGIGSAVGNDFLMGYLILSAVFLIFLILSLNFDIKQVLIMDGFVCTILAILLYASGLLPITATILPALIMFITMIWYYLSG